MRILSTSCTFLTCQSLILSAIFASESVSVLAFAPSSSSCIVSTNGASSAAATTSLSKNPTALYMAQGNGKRKNVRFEPRQRFNYEIDFADRVGGTPDHDVWSRTVRNQNGKRRSRPPTSATDTRTVNGKDNYQTDFADRIGGSPDVDGWSNSVKQNLKGNRLRQRRRDVPVVPDKRTVNGMYDFNTDFADRIGGPPDVDSWSRPTNQNAKPRMTSRRATPSADRRTVNGMNDFDTDFADRIGRRPDVDSWSRPTNGVTSKQDRIRRASTPPPPVDKRTVNGMNDFETDFADRIGSKPDVDSWSTPTKKNFKVSPLKRRTIPNPDKRTVNGMNNYDTDFADRIGGRPDVDSWSRSTNAVTSKQNRIRRAAPAPAADKRTVNGMNDFETDFADRIGSKPDVDSWSRPANYNNPKKSYRGPNRFNRSATSGFANYDDDFEE